jgi:integrase
MISATAKRRTQFSPRSTPAADRSALLEKAAETDLSVVGTYLATISETKSVATIRRRMVAVAHRDVQKVLAGIVRTKTVAQKRKDALTTDRLEEAVKALGTGLKGQRDRALLLLTSACALRRAEAAALDVADSEPRAHG